MLGISLERRNRIVGQLKTKAKQTKQKDLKKKKEKKRHLGWYLVSCDKVLCEKTVYDW